MNKSDGQAVTPTSPLTWDWYSKIPNGDRKVVDATAEWLAPIPWQLFATFTFPWEVNALRADWYFKRVINELEKALRHRICYFAGRERKPRSVGSEVPWHFHVLLAAECPIPAKLVSDTWRSLVGIGNRTLTHPNGDSVDLREFDPDKRGVEYCIKVLNDSHGDWSFRWLELFNIKMPRSGVMNHRKLRQLRRSAAQASSASIL